MRYTWLFGLFCLLPVALAQPLPPVPLPEGWTRRCIDVEVRRDGSLREVVVFAEGTKVDVAVRGRSPTDNSLVRFSFPWHGVQMLGQIHQRALVVESGVQRAVSPGLAVAPFARSERTLLLKDPRLDQISAMPPGTILSLEGVTTQDGPRVSRGMYADRIVVVPPRGPQVVLPAPPSAVVVADRAAMTTLTEGARVRMLIPRGTRVELLRGGAHGGDWSHVRVVSPTGGWLVGAVRSRDLRREIAAPPDRVVVDPRKVPVGFPAPDPRAGWREYRVSREAVLRDLAGQPLGFLPAGMSVNLISRRDADRLVHLSGTDEGEGMMGLLQQGDIVDGAGQDEADRWTRPSQAVGFVARLAGGEPSAETAPAR